MTFAALQFNVFTVLAAVCMVLGFGCLGEIRRRRAQDRSVTALEVIEMALLVAFGLLLFTGSR